MNSKKQRLAEYTQAVQKANANTNHQTLEALNHKINEAIRQIRESEDRMEDCLEKDFPRFQEELGPTKSEEERYATKSCDELRAMLIPLLRKINQPQRREHSVFSELSPSERTELLDARRVFGDVTAILKERCATPQSGQQRKRQTRN